MQPTIIKADKGILDPPPAEVDDELLSTEDPTRALTRIIPDPTGKTSGYRLEVQKSNNFELLGSRGQTSRHFYDKTSGFYTYQSDSLVQKAGLVEGTPWVTFDEFPNEFLIQLRNGTRNFFQTPEAIEDYLSSLDLSELSVIGLETFIGIMGFNMDFSDNNGHSQYLYWPRFSNGTLSDYEMPLLEIYAHLYAKQNSQWTDAILNDKNLFTTSIDPRSTLEFFIDNNRIGLQFTTPTINLHGATWNVRHGFKFDLTDRLFHMITEFECLTADFEDIGLTYDILTSPQAEGTPFELTNFLLTNCNKTISVGNNEAWQAGSLLEEYDSKVELVAQNGQSFSFVFDDMVHAGFSAKHLNFQEVVLPSGFTQEVLRAGMDGFGAYTRDTWIEIDPTAGPLDCDIDDWDLWQDNSAYQTGNNYIKVGEIDLGIPHPRRPWEHDYHTYRGWLAFDTEITTGFINISDTYGFLKLHVSATSMENVEGVSVYVYNIGNNFDSNSCKESSTSWSYGTYAFKSQVFNLDKAAGTGWKTSLAGKMYSLLDHWAKNRSYYEGYISLSLIDYACDKETGDGDVATITESTGSNYPQLSFNYTLDTSNISYCYAGSYSDNCSWSQVTEAYTDNGVGANSSTSGAQIDYGMNQTQFSTMNSTLNLTSWLFYECNVRIEWKVNDTGNTSSAYDDLYVKFYHNTTDSWTDWSILAHDDENWHADVVTESTNYWFPKDLQYLQIRFQHQNSSDGDEIEVDYVRLEVYNGSESWNPYLDSDWARHPSDYDIQQWVNYNITDYPNVSRAFELYNQTVADWNDSAAWDRYNDGENLQEFWQDTTILDDRKANGSYDMFCYQAAVILSAYARAEGIPSRVLYFYSEGGVYTHEHFSVELWIEDDWIPADCEDAYDWFGKGNDSIQQMHEKLEPIMGYPLTQLKLQKIWIFIFINESNPDPTSSQNIVVKMKDIDPEQYYWYKVTADFSELET
ncbi:MAG: transglutaminase domain-containing protein [Candidatus Hodarchaeales archaeon]